MSKSNEMNEKFKLYVDLNKEIVEFRKKQKEQKKVLQKLEEEIQQYMTDNNLNSLSLKDGEIIIYEKKTNQGFKKPAIIEKITEELNCNVEKAEELADSLLGNKVFTVENKIKVNIKK